MACPVQDLDLVLCLQLSAGLLAQPVLNKCLWKDSNKMTSRLTSKPQPKGRDLLVFVNTDLETPGLPPQSSLVLVGASSPWRVP